MVCRGENGIQNTNPSVYVRKNLRGKLDTFPHPLDADKSIKHWLKLVRWQFRRFGATLHWGPGSLAEVPAVLGNAMPKSGSHLIIQVLQGLTRIGPFVNPGFPPVNRTENNQKLSEIGILNVLSRMRPGDIGYGYIDAKDIFIEVLTRPEIATVFVYRDPRDMIISHVFYASEMYQNHGMHKYYTEKLNTMEERVNAAIGGVTERGFELKSVRARYDSYYKWLHQSEILSIRFEDLRLNRDKAFNNILEYIEKKGFRSKIGRQQGIEILGEAISPRKSGTFRKGKVGSWQDYFTQNNVDYFKQTTGDLLMRWGYEKDNSWSLDQIG
jgi:hypothetical protein